MLKDTSVELDFATDIECETRRNLLIKHNIITPAKDGMLVVRKDGSEVVSTKNFCTTERQRLINLGLIDINLCKLIPEKNRPVLISEEGEYRARPIKTVDEYNRRKAAYFRMIQEILYSRKELNLILAKKEESDPDWFF